MNPDRLRFSRGDASFVALCLFVMVAGAAAIRWGFDRAFPEASINFRVTGGEAEQIAARTLEGKGFQLAGTRRLVLFEHDEAAKTYLERTLGLSQANREFATVGVWWWAVRFVRPLERLEYLAHVSPDGRLVSYQRILPEDAAIPDLGEDEARRAAEAEFRATFGGEPTDRSRYRFIERTVQRKPQRVDRTFVFESEVVRHGDGALRMLVEMQGNEVGRCSASYKVPEKWRQEYRTLRSKNETLGAVATLGLFLTALAVLGVVLERIRMRDIRWRTALGFGAVGGVLQLAVSLNELPVALFDYDTTQKWGDALGKALLGCAGGAITLGVILVVLVAAGEPLARHAFPDHPALSRIFSWKALGTRSAFRGLLLGWALTVVFVAYQVLFYIGAEKAGAWAPADIPYSNLLGTRFPWLAVLLAGFLPATTEEFSSRLFSIPFLQRFSPTWVAVVVPALIWGFAHSAYPNQPFWIRGVEVGLAGIVIGAIFVKAGIFPLLVWHFTVDAIYTALILLRSSNPTMVASGAVAGGILLLPLVASLSLLLRRRGFQADDFLWNRGLPGGASPRSPSMTFDRSEAEETGQGSPVSLAPWSRRTLLGVAGGAFLLLLLSRFVLPRVELGRGDPVRVDRAQALAQATRFLVKSGDDPDRYLSAPFFGFALPALESGSDDGFDSIPYSYSPLAERWLLEHGGSPLLSRWAMAILPGPVWQVRFIRPEDRNSWWVVVSARTGEVVSYRRHVPEEAPGARLPEPAALEAGNAALKALRLSPSGFSIVSAAAEERKNRRDTRIIYESKVDEVGEARRRLAVAIGGDAPLSVSTGLKLPEAWVRAGEKWNAWSWASLFWKVAGLGTLLGLLLVELIRLVRTKPLRWKTASFWAAGVAGVGTVGQIVSLPSALREIDPGGVSFQTMAASVGVGLLFRIAGTFALALVAIVVLLDLRPDAFSPRRWTSSGRRAFLVSCSALLLLLAGRSLVSNVRSVLPLQAGIGPAPALPGIETWQPALALLVDAVSTTLWFSALAAFGTLLWRDVLPTRASRLVTLPIVLGVFAPVVVRTGGELLVQTLVAFLPFGALLIALFLLQADPRAFALTGLLAVLIPGGARLLLSGVPSWTWSGVATLLLAGGLAAATSFVGGGFLRSGEDGTN